MKNYTIGDLLLEGYILVNAKIVSVDLSMEDHACMTLRMDLEGDGWGVVYGGYSLGRGYVGATTFESGEQSMEYIMRIMDVVGSDTFKGMEGMYVRVAEKGFSDPVKIIGNIVKDKWFDAGTFFE